MDIVAAAAYVEEKLGRSFRLLRVESDLVPGPSEGSPTQRRVRVVIDYHPGFRSEKDEREGVAVSSIGPHLRFEGTAGSIEEAVLMAQGEALTDPIVERIGNPADWVADR